MVFVLAAKVVRKHSNDQDDEPVRWPKVAPHIDRGNMAALDLAEQPVWKCFGRQSL
jgi:hypothetical protein